jgi:hypothetical protein
MDDHLDTNALKVSASTVDLLGNPILSRISKVFGFVSDADGDVVHDRSTSEPADYSVGQAHQMSYPFTSVPQLCADANVLIY